MAERLNNEMSAPIAPPAVLYDDAGNRWIYSGTAPDGLPCYAPAQSELIPAHAPKPAPEPFWARVGVQYVSGEGE